MGKTNGIRATTSVNVLRRGNGRHNFVRKPAFERLRIDGAYYPKVCLPLRNSCISEGRSRY